MLGLNFTAFCAQVVEILMIDKLISVNQWNPINDLLFRVSSLRHNKIFIHLFVSGLVSGLWSLVCDILGRRS